MNMNTVHAAFPEVLAVREDLSNYNRHATEGGTVSSDLLSVYLEGGPRYAVNRTVCPFKPPAALLFPRGTHDRDLQEGPVRGIYVLFQGHGLLQRRGCQAFRRPMGLSLMYLCYHWSFPVNSVCPTSWPHR